MDQEMILILLLIFCGGIAAFLFKKLSIAGALAGMITAAIVYLGAGAPGFLSMAAFFILATAATGYNKSKRQAGAEHEQNRNSLQVLANSLLAGIAAALNMLYPHPLFPLVVAAVFSSAVADTVSSEMGMATGRRFFNILSWKPDEKGKDGVVSWEGLSWGLAGSMLIAAIHAGGTGWDAQFFIVVFAGTMGNIADSILGATLERKGLAGNNTVNFLNTLAAAAAACILFFILDPATF